VQSVVRWGYLDRWPATIVERTIAHRLRGFDYSSDGSYLVTICTHRRLPILTDDCHDLDRELEHLAMRFAGVTVNCQIVMPDHVHAILMMVKSSSTLSEIVQAYKSISARQIRRRITAGRVWQRGFHDRVIRNDLEHL